MTRKIAWEIHTDDTLAHIWYPESNNQL